MRFVTSGTAANAICLATLCKPFEAVLAHEHATSPPIEDRRAGVFGHGLGSSAGRRVREDRPNAFWTSRCGPDQASSSGAGRASLTNATEYGTVYTVQALKALIGPVKARGYGVHLDGARLANAAAAGFDLKSIKSLGVDMLVIGGTKAGMTPSEAIVMFDRSLARRFDARLKQSGQLPSKGRFFAAPFIGMLEDGAFVRHAAHANAMARPGQASLQGHPPGGGQRRSSR